MKIREQIYNTPKHTHGTRIIFCEFFSVSVNFIMVVSDYPVEFCSSIYHNPGLELNVFPVSIPSHLEMLVHIMKSPGCFRVNMNTDLLIHCEETIVHLIRQ